MEKTNEQWKKELTPEQFQVCRLKGTERPFSGQYHDHHQKGMYKCVACGAKLFGSDSKFESGTGWPSFWEAFDHKNIDLKEDTTHGMRRVEVLCKHCGSHLGHVFDDGPPPSGKRFCINSASLDFEKES